MNASQASINIKEYSKAVELCDKVLADDDKNMKSLYRRGVAYGRTQDFEKAKVLIIINIDWFQEASWIRPKSWRIKKIISKNSRRGKTSETKGEENFRRYVLQEWTLRWCETNKEGGSQKKREWWGGDAWFVERRDRIEGSSIMILYECCKKFLCYFKILSAINDKHKTSI